MTDWKTIRIPAVEWQKHNDHRQDLGLTWAEYIDAEAYRGGSSPTAPDYDRLREIVREEVQDALQEVAQ